MFVRFMKTEKNTKASKRMVKEMGKEKFIFVMEEPMMGIGKMIVCGVLEFSSIIMGKLHTKANGRKMNSVGEAEHSTINLKDVLTHSIISTSLD